jgi:hypothetical protein
LGEKGLVWEMHEGRGRRSGPLSWAAGMTGMMVVVFGLIWEGYVDVVVTGFFKWYLREGETERDKYK